MTLRLTPDTIVAAYEYLRTTAPFKGWRLPHADDVEFHAVPLSAAMGDYLATDRGKSHRIRICAKRCRDNEALLTTMAHEMTHLQQRRLDIAKGQWSAGHGRNFKALAAKVCRAHGFDPKTF